MRRPNPLLAFVLALLSLCLWLQWFGPVRPPQPVAAGERAATTPPPSVADDARATEPDDEREAVDAAAAPGTFVSKLQDAEEPIADPQRDGLCVLVLRGDRSPYRDAAITVQWRQSRKDLGFYGSDAGRTDAQGRFPTTVHAIEQIEGIELQDPELGELRTTGDLLPQASDANTVVIVVPALAPVQLQLVDLAGRPIAHGTIAAAPHGDDAPPREHWLRGNEHKVATDERGQAKLLLPLGWFEFTAVAAGHHPLQTLYAEVPAGGRSLRVMLLADDARHDVDVRVHAPAGVEGDLMVRGFCGAVPLAANRAQHAHGESDERMLSLTRVGPGHYVVQADALPWRVFANATGCEAARADVGAQQTAVELTLVPSPVPAMAHLTCTVTGPDGAPLAASVQVCERPQLAHGGEATADAQGHAELNVAAKGTVCVVATHDRLAPAIAGPIALTPGEHAVRLQFAAAQELHGKVVDAAGQPVAAWVSLRRPLGPLRALAADAPEFDNLTDSDWQNWNDGVFAFAAVGPGEHELLVRPTFPGWPARVRVHAGQDVTVALGQGMERMALVRGVLRSPTGQPLVTAQLRWIAGAEHHSLYTDAEGRFAFAAPPGPLAIEVWAPGCVCTPQPPRDLAAGEHTIDLTAVASPPRFVRIVDASGLPLHGAEVSALDARGEPLDLADANGTNDGIVERTNVAGRAHLLGLPPSPLRLRVTVGEQSREFALTASDGVDAVHTLRW